jgi:DNA-binding response OmpR family regulator
MKRESPAGQSLNIVRRIICVDDEPDTAESLALLLNVKGYDAVAVASGRAALDLAFLMRPHGIVLDIGLPDVDGLEVCRRIRQEAWGQAITILAFSGWTGREFQRASIKAGCDDHLIKPLDVDSLCHHLGRHRASRGPGRQGIEVQPVTHSYDESAIAPGCHASASNGSAAPKRY